MATKRNPADLTLRNLRAAAKRTAKVDERLAIAFERTDVLLAVHNKVAKMVQRVERELGALEDQFTLLVLGLDVMRQAHNAVAAKLYDARIISAVESKMLAKKIQVRRLYSNKVTVLRPGRKAARRSGK